MYWFSFFAIVVISSKCTYIIKFSIYMKFLRPVNANACKYMFSSIIASYFFPFSPFPPSTQQSFAFRLFDGLELNRPQHGNAVNFILFEYSQTKCHDFHFQLTWKPCYRMTFVTLSLRPPSLIESSFSSPNKSIFGVDSLRNRNWCDVWRFQWYCCFCCLFPFLFARRCSTRLLLQLFDWYNGIGACVSSFSSTITAQK